MNKIVIGLLLFISTVSHAQTDQKAIDYTKTVNDCFDGKIGKFGTVGALLEKVDFSKDTSEDLLCFKIKISSLVSKKFNYLNDPKLATDKGLQVVVKELTESAKGSSALINIELNSRAVHKIGESLISKGILSIDETKIFFKKAE